MKSLSPILFQRSHYLWLCVKALNTPSRSSGLISFFSTNSSTIFSMMLESDGSSLSNITTPENIMGGDQGQFKKEMEERWTGGSKWNMDRFKCGAV